MTSRSRAAQRARLLVVALATLLVLAPLAAHAATIKGTNGNNKLNGTGRADTIDGKGGNDKLAGKGGNDKLYGRAGNDTLLGAAGLDVLDGGPGNDTLDGGTDADDLRAGEGNDTARGDTGNDKIGLGGGNDRGYGEAGNDQVDGQTGDDRVEGGAGNDHLSGGDGADTLFGSTGDDEMDGGPGNDVIYPGASDPACKPATTKQKWGCGNQVTGDPGDDRIFLEKGSLNKVYGEEGFNTVYNWPDADQDDIFCGWVRDQNYGKLVYYAPLDTPVPDPAVKTYFGDNVKCCSIWLKDPDTGDEVVWIDDKARIRCAVG